jgi:hypothetical protein
MLREPQHGSWLNMAESKIAVFTRQCLDRRIADRKTLAKQTAAWQKQRNKHHAKARWQFTTADARIKLRTLYPTFWMTRTTGSAWVKGVPCDCVLSMASGVRWTS